MINNIKELIKIIKIDFSQNLHPKNRLFLITYRCSNFFYKRNFFLWLPFRIILKLFYNRNNHIPSEVVLGKGVRFPHLFGIVLSGECEIGNYCTIYHGVTIGVDEFKSCKAAKIGNGCFIGAGAKIIGDISIGDNVIIGANAVITKNIPSNVTVVGSNKIINID